MFKKTHIFLVVAAALATFFIFGGEAKASIPFIGQAQAQEETSAADQALTKIAEEQIIEQAKPEAVKIDEKVEAKDLDVTDPKILPDSPLYIFKKFGRVIRQTLTFDSVKKAEQRLEDANTQLIEAKKLVEKKGGEDTAKVLEKAMAGFQKNIEAIAKQAENIKQGVEKDIEKKIEADKFLDKFTAQQFKQQKILQKLEEKVPEQVFIKIKEAREQHLEKFGEVMNRLEESKEKVAERLKEAMEQQAGSDFKNFKLMEILKVMEEEAPNELKTAIQRAQEGALEKLKAKAEEKKEEFKKYIEFMPGEASRQMAILDDLKREIESPELVRDMDVLKDKMVKKFEQDFNRFEGSLAKEKFIEHLKDGEIGDIQVIKHLEVRLPEEISKEVKKAESEALEKFKEQFKDDPRALETAEAFKKFKENPAVADFEVIKTLEENLTPEQKGFIKKVKDEGLEKMSRKIKEEGDKFIQRFVGTDPRQIEVLKSLQVEAPSAAQAGLAEALGAQVERISEHMEKMDDQEMFKRVKEDIIQNEAIRKEMETRERGFFQKMETRENEFFKKVEEREKEIPKIEEEIPAPVVPSEPVKLEMKEPEKKEAFDRLEKFFKLEEPTATEPIEVKQEPKEKPVEQKPLIEFLPKIDLMPRIEPLKSVEPIRIEQKPIIEFKPEVNREPVSKTEPVPKAEPMPKTEQKPIFRSEPFKVREMPSVLPR